MKRFIKYYALEIYTVLALSFIVATAVIVNLSTVQKLVVVDALLFVLHEWEEGHYPGGFIKLISGLVGIKVDDRDEPCQQNSCRYPAADTKHRTVCFRHDTFDYRRRGNLRFHRVFCPYDGHQTFSHEAVLYARHGDGMVGICRKRDDDNLSCSERYCPVV